MSAPPLIVRVGLWPPDASAIVDHERAASREAGCDYRFIADENVSPTIDLLEHADAVICTGGLWTAAVFARLVRCRVVVSCTVGLDHIDLEAAASAGIPVTSMPDICTDEVADHTLALLLACARKIALHDRAARDGVWDTQLLHGIPRLRGLTLGVVGLGRIGRAVSSRALAFGMKVIAHDPLVTSIETGEVELVSLSALCTQSDAVTLHVPLSDATRHLIGDAEFAAMKPTAYLINTCRGAVVDQQALIDALVHGRVRGAGLDVLAEEPPQPSNELLQLPNVVLTPHMAGYSEDSVAELGKRAIREVMTVLQQHVPSQSAAPTTAS